MFNFFFFTSSHDKIVHVFIIANEVKKLLKKSANHCPTKTKKSIRVLDQVQSQGYYIYLEFNSICWHLLLQRLLLGLANNIYTSKRSFVHIIENVKRI